MSSGQVNKLSYLPQGDSQSFMSLGFSAWAIAVCEQSKHQAGAVAGDCRVLKAWSQHPPQTGGGRRPHSLGAFPKFLVLWAEPWGQQVGPRNICYMKTKGERSLLPGGSFQNITEMGFLRREIKQANNSLVSKDWNFFYLAHIAALLRNHL